MLRKIILNSLYYTGAQALLARWMRGSGSILMLHHVQNRAYSPFLPNDHLTIAPEFLEKVITTLKAKGYEFISMDEVAKRVAHPDRFSDKPPFIAVTLDDGYRNNLEQAVPIFNRHQVPYTIYIAPGFVEGHTPLWWEDIEAIIGSHNSIYMDTPNGTMDFDLSTLNLKLDGFDVIMDYLTTGVSQEEQRQVVKGLCEAYHWDQSAHLKNEIMTWEEINILSKDPLCTIGAHSIEHYALSKLDEDKLRFEMKQSRKLIESEIGYAPKHFAYPYGSKNEAGKREFQIAKQCGFISAVTTRHGVIYPEHKDHPMALPRIALNGYYQSMNYIHPLLSGVSTRLNNSGRKLDVE